MYDNSNFSNLRRFYESTSKEIIAIKDRVRNLIGNANWGEEGSYKESILRNILRRVIPKSYTIGTGFAIKKQNHQLLSSSQIDILIIDNKFPVLLNEGEFYIVSPNSVRAVIEVKTNARNQELKKIVEKMNKIGNFLDVIYRQYTQKRIFYGVFSFEGNYSESYIRSNMISELNNNNYVNHISLNNKIFLKLWGTPPHVFYSVYKLENLSFAYFISNLISYLTTFDGSFSTDEQLLYPTDKEEDRWFTIPLIKENKNMK